METSNLHNHGSQKDEAILRALSGLYCSVCDAPLSTQDKKSSTGKRQLHSAFTCCGTAHCPYCGASDKEMCVHLLASRINDVWRFYMSPNAAEVGLPDPVPVTGDRLLDYSEAQKQAVWGKSYSLLTKLYGPGWQYIENAIPSSDIVKRLRPENWQDVRSPYNTATKQYYFSPRSDIAVERLRQTFLTDLANAFPCLLRTIPEGSEFVLNVIFTPSELIHTRLDYNVAAVAFSPCGRYFALLGSRTGTVWGLATINAAPVTRFSIADYAEDVSPKYCSVKFSSDGNFLSARCFDPFAYDKIQENFIEVRSVQNGALITVLPEGGDIPFQTGSFLQQEVPVLDGFLHGGRTYVTVRERCVRLYDLQNPKKRSEPFRTFTLRVSIEHLAIAPDGETFITTAGSYAVVWRVPGHAMGQSEQGS